MKWSWKIGRFFGIDVNIHVTFFLMVGWIGLTYWFQENTIAAVVSGVGFLLALFGSVVLHEYGHALTARRYGVKTRDITLYPIGGVARLERIPEKPIEELWVALAGPLVNVVIAGGLFGWLIFTGSFEPIFSSRILWGSFVERLMITNLLLVGFNLIPAFPMDGGRVLRALLAMRLDYTVATRVAATIGQGLAFLFGIWGLFSNPFLVIIALFVWVGAANEYRMVRVKYSLNGIPISSAMLTDFDVLDYEDKLYRAAELIMDGSQNDFPVLAGDQVVGILGRNDVFRGLREAGGFAYVKEIMERDFPIVEAQEMLETVWRRLQECNCQTLPVLQNDRLVGLITLDQVGEFIQLQSSMPGSTAY